MRVAAFLLLALGLGCASPQDRLSAGGTLASGRLEVLGVETTEGPRGCRVEVRNRTGGDLRLQARVRWFSAEGREVRRGTPSWQDISLSAGAAASIVSTAPASWCRRFEIDFREVP